MNREETIIILGILKTAYPRFYMDMTKEQANQTINLWHEMLEDVPIEIVKAATKKLISQFKFPPTIADIREKIADITTKEISVDDAWGQVTRAIRRYGAPSEKEALASMDKDVANIVKRMGWKSICMTEVEKLGVIRGQFLKIYEGSIKKKKEDAMLPNKFKKQIEQLTQNTVKQLEG